MNRLPCMPGDIVATMCEPLRLLRAISVTAVVALLFGCAPVTPPLTDRSESALSKFLGVTVGQTVVHSGCYGIRNCIDECFEYCPNIPGWKTRFIRNPMPQYVDDRGQNFVGVDAQDVVQAMEIHTKSSADSRRQVLADLQAAFGSGEKQGGDHIVWHPAGGLVDFYQTHFEYMDDIYIFSLRARAALPRRHTSD